MTSAFRYFNLLLVLRASPRPVQVHNLFFLLPDFTIVVLLYFDQVRFKFAVPSTYIPVHTTIWVLFASLYAHILEYFKIEGLVQGYLIKCLNILVLERLIGAACSIPLLNRILVLINIQLNCLRVVGYFKWVVAEAVTVFESLLKHLVVWVCIVIR